MCFEDEVRVMKDKIWALFKENFTVLIGVSTAVITVIYSLLKFVIYIYWSGYFSQLNIDNTFLNINFDGFIFQVIFFVIIGAVIVYVMTMVDATANQIKEKHKSLKVKWFKRIGSFIISNLCFYLISGILLSLANIPLLIVIFVMLHTDISVLYISVGLCLAYIYEMLFYVLYNIENKKCSDVKKSAKDTWENRIGMAMLKGLLLLSLWLAIIYYAGSQAYVTGNTVRLVEDEQYAITYSDGEIYILHKVKLENEKAVIYRNEQRIISTEDCNSTVRKVEEIVICD